MKLDELKSIIQASDGKCFALEYAEALLEKVNCIEANEKYAALIAQLRAAKEQGDLRGRVLEVNFVNAFAEHGVELDYGVKQGMPGDIDFCWSLSDLRVFIEMKLLGEDNKTKESIKQQLAEHGVSATFFTEDTYDVARIQRDIFSKSSIKKFNPKPGAKEINLVAVDVSELQLGTVDIGDCLLAALGNKVAAQYYHPSILRPQIVGVFEYADIDSLRPEQVEWIREFHKLPDTHPHPREYIHGILFLFREPKERAALSYQLNGAVTWNPALMDEKRAGQIANTLHHIIPCVGVES